MTPWEEIRKMRAQHESMLAVLHDRIVEAAGPSPRGNDGTRSVPWVETSSDWAMLKNARIDWTDDEIKVFCSFVRSLGFARVVIYDVVGKCVHSS